MLVAALTAAGWAPSPAAASIGPTVDDVAAIVDGVTVQVPGEGEGDGGGEILTRGGEGGDPPIVPFVISGIVLLAAVVVALVLRSRRPPEEADEADEPDEPET